jgi:hypothetical protein
MGINVGRPAAARLYDAIAQQIQPLTFGERLQLVNLMTAQAPYAEVPARLRAAFDQVVALMKRGGGLE